MLVTNKGLIAQGESEYCGTIDGGLDCGKYILTYHKLFDGLINNCTAYDNGQCSQCENGYQNNGTSCKDIRENTCDTYSGTTCTKCTSSNLLADGECIDASSLNCRTTDGIKCTKCSSNYYLTDNDSCSGFKYKTDAHIAMKYQAASDYCDGQNMTLPTKDQFLELYNTVDASELQLRGEWYMTKTEADANHVYMVSLSDGAVETLDKNGQSNAYNGNGALVICVDR